MARILIAVVIGAVLAVGATFLASSLVLGVSNGTPTNATLYNYGSR